METQDVIDIANDTTRSNKDYAMFDLNARNTKNIRSKINVAWLNFKPMMF